MKHLQRYEFLAQLAEKAQNWLFFGLLAVVGVHPNACVIVVTGECLLQYSQQGYFQVSRAMLSTRMEERKIISFFHSSYV